LGDFVDPYFLPPAFLEKIKDMIPASEFNAFVESTNTPLRKCIRINTLRTDDVGEIVSNLKKEGISLAQMPWYKYGFFITERTKEKAIGNTLEHFLGHFYVQEASSMLPVIALAPKPKDAVLDMAAAPGSKTTQISMHMQNTGLVIANEPQLQRIPALQENLERSGSLNHIITRNDGRVFKKMENSFDCVLVDAPCSVEGTFRKDIKARHLWQQGKVIQIARLQIELLRAAVDAAKRGSTIVYSTCTFSPEENEMIIDRILKEQNVELQKLSFEGLEYDAGLIKYRDKDFDKELKKTIRIWPNKTNMEGFYLAKLVKL